MRLAVIGLWHLGTVTAACLAAKGHTVIAFDDDVEVICALRQGLTPVSEPGLSELVREQMNSGQLQFSSDRADLAGFNLYWICYDTPVDENDRADVDFVARKVLELGPSLITDATVVISSQLPVGSTARLEALLQAQIGSREVHLAYAPENLRLGRAIQTFMSPEVTVVGTRSSVAKERLTSLFKSIAPTVDWMSVESAEMTKHALNAFLATSVVFANEIAVICEQTGADAQDVERALRRDRRIGASAYIRPGGAFDGGTLARDVTFLRDVAREYGVPSILMDGVMKSNDAHKGWTRDVIERLLRPVQGKRITVLGLTYKPETNTLRRSGAVELCTWLHDLQAIVTAYDPAVPSLPPGMERIVTLHSSVKAAAVDSDAVVIATPWPEFADIQADDLRAWSANPLVIDPSGFLRTSLESNPYVRYVSVGHTR